MAEDFYVEQLRADMEAHLRRAATRIRMPVDDGVPLEFEMGNAVHRGAAGVGVWFEAAALASSYIKQYPGGGLSLAGENWRVVLAKDFYRREPQGPGLGEMEC